MELTIRDYTAEDERQWLRCRVLAFLDSAFFDDVARSKPTYRAPSVELVAEDANGALVGLIDVECEVTPGSVCSARPGRGGMVWNLAVHPDHRRLGVASALLDAAKHAARALGCLRLEAWTRDDAGTLRWYQSHGFEQIDQYLQVYLNADECTQTLSSSIERLHPVHALAHFGDAANFERIRAQFERVHETTLFELHL